MLIRNNIIQLDLNALDRSQLSQRDAVFSLEDTDETLGRKVEKNRNSIQ